MNVVNKLIVVLVVWGFSLNAQYLTEKQGFNVLSKTLVLKVKQSEKDFFATGDFSKTMISSLLSKIDFISFSRKFPNHSEPVFYGDDPTSYRQVDLTSFYELIYRGNYDEELVSNYFMSTGLFEYVDMIVVPDLLYTPNDPGHTSQYHLALIDAYGAWDVTKGDTSIVIGITDTGTNLNHSDLKNNLKKNYSDPINGIDDDNDGYIDNYNGWDLGMNDNDPTWQASKHGISVAGCAVATVDNGNQGAAVGFNTKYLPVKISNASGQLTKSYDGIVYAADHGCSIINCSWGSQGGKSQYGQDIIDYATFNKGALVVAAAGNNNNDKMFYPASYQNVLSVGGVNKTDEKWVGKSNWGSNYNSAVDVTAPALGIYTTSKNISGVIGSGTSFASPMVAGAAALVRSVYPNYTPNQIAGVISMTADDNYSAGSNSNYAGQLGFGRLNAQRAVTENNKPYLQFLNFTATDGFENNFITGDTIEISVELINYLKKSSIGSAVLSSADGKVSVVDGVSSVKSLDMMESAETDNKFRVAIINTSGTNEDVVFNLEVTADGITWIEEFTIQINRDYIDVTFNDLDFSFNNYGRIGYTYAGSGMGVQHNGEALISSMGVVMGTCNDTVLSYEDFELLGFGNSTLSTNGSIADYEITGEFDDSWAPVQLGINVKQSAYLWSAVEDKDYTIYEYTVFNPSADDIKGLHFGVYGDWDIGDKTQNTAAFDALNNLGYVYENNGKYGGIKALRTSKSNYYAFNNDGSAGSINIDDGFNDQEEFDAISGGNSRLSADLGDVSQMVSQGPFDILAGDSLTVAFALIAGSDLKSIIDAAKRAELKYENIRGIDLNINDLSNVSCNGLSDAGIDLNIAASLAPYTIEWNHDPANISSSLNNLGKGVYQVSVKDRNDVMKTMNFSITEPDSLIVSSTQTNYSLDCFGDNTSVQVDVTGGTSGYNYNWNNLFIPGVANPSLGVGEFKVDVTDSRGCMDSLEFNITEPLALKITEEELTNDDLNKCLGEIVTRSTGGVAPYSFQWNDSLSQTTETAINLCEGNYELEVVDANGCFKTMQFEIEGGDIEVPDALKEHKSTFVNVYPNPALDVVTLELPITAVNNLSYSVLTVAGRTVQKGVFDNLMDGRVSVDISDLSTGSYHLVFNDQASSYRASFQVIK